MGCFDDAGVSNDEGMYRNVIQPVDMARDDCCPAQTAIGREAMWMIPSSAPIDGYRASPRERMVSFVLAVVTVVLVFLVMLRMGAITGFGGGEGSRLVAITVSEEGEKGEDKAPEQQKQQKSDNAQAKPVSAPAVTAPPPVSVPGKVQWPEGFIQLSRSDYAATDIGKMKRQPAGGDAGAKAGGAGEGAGEGPGGVRLYNAQWYREPTDAEIGPYMPARRTAGDWAMIACRTIDKYHVEDCQELDESPRGSGLARALRQASWQFLVRPPRINGKAQVGEWVRIRFDFRSKKAEREEG
ncbi:hypothetical protein OVA07_11295 [Novosphingobium sp. SL115]|uniref:hypothetical protein n=1 Tax=Novosphingobium sp. SL115 TaxID=2995150 RepID=UPI0022740BEA|nr:hypothetical protein [Novosphingobium sp. SL115]MCY1671592.1 hypothetical protein [Novosphingobium sp. SL115]